MGRRYQRLEQLFDGNWCKTNLFKNNDIKSISSLLVLFMYFEK
ncbi:hypothetical protein D347_02177 [Enterococcus faecalis LA3B-2]|nr:hypothetical protein D347_02177 [Enterococcus faecalis LA3B-2]